MTDFTLTITSLVTTKYIDGKDPSTHIAKMKGFRRDLMLMQQSVNDELFTCFLRISMPPTWNYVFAGLPQKYSSAEVERRIKDEHGIKSNQQSVAMAYQAMHNTSRGRNKRKPDNTECSNCHNLSHTYCDCWLKGGGAEGKGPRSRRKPKQPKGKRREDKQEKRDTANQAITDESDNESQSSPCVIHGNITCLHIMTTLDN